MKTERTSLNRLPYRGAHDRETIDGILDNNFLCHVAVVVDGKPRCIPTAYGRKGDYLYLHGSVKSPLMQTLAAGGEACVTVTQLDGIVLARSLFHSSMNYQSVVVFGKGEEVIDHDEKMEALEAVTESIWKGRWEEARIPTPGEMKATTAIRIPLSEGSAKIRTGGAVDNKEDYELPIWAGVIPVTMEYGEPQPDEKLDPSTPLPNSVSNQ